MKYVYAILFYALGVSLINGCDRLEQVVDLGRKAQVETKLERDRQLQAEERQASLLQAERDSLKALINGKMAVLSNRVTETETAIRTLQADRLAFSKELGATMSGGRDVTGAALERALASPVISELAMKYLHMDFSVARGEYAEALAQARKNDVEFKREAQKLNDVFKELVDPDPQAGSANRRARLIVDLKREYAQLERKRERLSREKIPTGNVYSNQRNEHDRQVRIVDNRMNEIERLIDRLKTGDASERKDANLFARNMRERALGERNRAMESLKKDYESKASVLKTVQVYNEKTLRRLEQALVKTATELDEKLRKSREGCLTLQGIGASVPKLSAGGLKKLQGQVQAL